MTVTQTVRSMALTAALAGAATFATPAAYAQSVESVYEGQTMTILLGHPPGGSYDLYAQLAAEFMGAHIPGNPEIIVQHQPGGDGRRATAFFVNATDPDGLTVAILPDSLGHVQLLSADAADWNAADFRYIGRFASAPAAFAIRSALATSAEDIGDQEVVFACLGANARSAQQAAALRNAAGLNLRLVCGYQGSQASVLAALRGEADMMTQNYASFVADPNDLGDGELTIVIQTGLERHPDLPDVPLMQELTDDPQGQAILRFLGASAPIGRSMMAHPDTPDDIVDALREAFQAMITSEEFLAAAAQRSAIIEPASGAQMEEVMAEIMSADGDLIDAVLAAIDTSGAEAVE